MFQHCVQFINSLLQDRFFDFFAFFRNFPGLYRKMESIIKFPNEFETLRFFNLTFFTCVVLPLMTETVQKIFSNMVNSLAFERQ